MDPELFGMIGGGMGFMGGMQPMDPFGGGIGGNNFNWGGFNPVPPGAGFGVPPQQGGWQEGMFGPPDALFGIDPFGGGIGGLGGGAIGGAGAGWQGNAEEQAWGPGWEQGMPGAGGGGWQPEFDAFGNPIFKPSMQDAIAARAARDRAAYGSGAGDSGGANPFSSGRMRSPSYGGGGSPRFGVGGVRIPGMGGMGGGAGGYGGAFGGAYGAGGQPGGFNMQGVVDQYQSAFNEAKAKNEQRYNDILGGYTQMKQRGMGYLDSLSGQQMTDIKDRGRQQLAQTDQSAIDRGLYNTTVLDALHRGVNTATGNELNRAQDAITQQRLATDTQLTGNKLGFMERRTDAYPDMNQMIALAKMSGQGGGMGGGFGGAGGAAGGLGGGAGAAAPGAAPAAPPGFQAAGTGMMPFALNPLGFGVGPGGNPANPWAASANLDASYAALQNWQKTGVKPAVPYFQTGLTGNPTNVTQANLGSIINNMSNLRNAHGGAWM